jgi:hypothetical protein
MGILGNLNQYAQFQAANAMEAAAKNPAGGGASEGMGLGMGFAMASQMGQMFNPNQQNQNQQGPPPVPGGPVQFFVAINGQQQGPYSIETLQQMIKAGSLKADSLLWKQGMANWLKASDIAEVKDLFGAVPPPLPPQA